MAMSREQLQGLRDAIQAAARGLLPLEQQGPPHIGPEPVPTGPPWRLPETSLKPLGRLYGRKARAENHCLRVVLQPLAITTSDYTAQGETLGHRSTTPVVWA